jgi:hypothetical protein
VLGLARYPWTVLLEASLGWGFDVFDALLFNFVAPNAGDFYRGAGAAGGAAADPTGHRDTWPEAGGLAGRRAFL